MEVPLRKAAFFTLSRQHLLEKAPRGLALDVVDKILGLNAQGAINVQLSLWNRVADLETGFIPKALHVDKSLVKTWIMRNTVHVIPSKQLPIYHKALERSLMMEWNRWTTKTGSKESVTSWEPMYPQVLKALEGGPLTIRQMQDALRWRDKESRVTLSRLVREMSLRGILCHAESLGPWHHTTQYSFARVDKWLPDTDLDAPSEDGALTSLARGYLRAYGPASISDFAYWAGMRVSEAKPAFDSLSGSLVEVTTPEQRGRLLILEEDVPTLLEEEEQPALARLLPCFDALIMGHKDKTRFIDPRVLNRILLPLGDIAATIMVNGLVQGVWTLRKMKKVWRVELSLFNTLSRDTIDVVKAEVDQLKKFTGFEIELVWKKAI